MESDRVRMRIPIVSITKSVLPKLMPNTIITTSTTTVVTNAIINIKKVNAKSINMTIKVELVMALKRTLFDRIRMNYRNVASVINKSKIFQLNNFVNKFGNFAFYY